MRKALVALLIAAAVAALLLLPRGEQHQFTAGYQAPAVDASWHDPANATAAEMRAETAGKPLVDTTAVPPSMAGAEIDGAIALDDKGDVIVDESLRRLFDHVLSSAGELSLDEIRALLASRLGELSHPRAAAQALALFERYLRYLQQAQSAAPQLSGLDLQERLNMLKDLRRSVLGVDMASAFFGREERYQEHTLAVRKLDPSLSPAERTRREMELVDTLPLELKAPILEHRQTQADLRDAMAIDSATSSGSERFARRKERFGESAAARMELLDRERLHWQVRVTDYQRERQRLNATGADHSAALDQYLRARFSEAEQRRIRSLEAIGEL